MKKYILSLFIAAITLSSCSKDDPTPEIDQEEVGKAVLTFTPVEKINGVYQPIDGEHQESIEFTGAQMLPPVDSHLHLHVGETYKLELKSFDFAGRESQQTFLNRHETHQAFLLGGVANSISFEYADQNNVGVAAFITINEPSETVTLRYIMRHLNPGVKSQIKASDWNNTNFTQFTGANDLDLKFSAHLVESHGHDH